MEHKNAEDYEDQTECEKKSNQTGEFVDKFIYFDDPERYTQIKSRRTSSKVHQDNLQEVLKSGTSFGPSQ